MQPFYLEERKSLSESHFPVKMISEGTLEYIVKSRKPQQIFYPKIVSDHRYNLYDGKIYVSCKGLALFMSTYINAIDIQ